jgi:hypothetical protein
MSDPHVCPECARVFNWGADADSADVDREGEQWISCRENAYWKLTFHMKSAHPDAGFYCGRRGESAASSRLQGKDFWNTRDGHKACSYCGSMSPDELFAAIDAGHQLGPTDKSYKVYVDLPNPEAGQIVEIGSESGPTHNRDGKRTRPDLTEAEIRSGHYDRKIMGNANATVHAKFYFQHLSVEQQQRFIDLLNAKKIKIGVPGYFYARPFFIAPPQSRTETPDAATA